MATRRAYVTLVSSRAPGITPVIAAAPRNMARAWAGTAGSSSSRSRCCTGSAGGSAGCPESGCQLLECEPQQRPERYGRVGGRPSHESDPGGGGDGARDNHRLHVLLGVGAGSVGDRPGEGALRHDGDFQVLAAYRGRAREEPDRGHVLGVEWLVGSLVVLEHRVGQRFQQRLAGRACPQRRADQLGPAGCQAADRLLLAGKVVPERPGCGKVKRNGVVYDTGTIYSGPGWKTSTRPRLDPGTVRRELQIIRDDLHCNAVRVRGRDVGRLTAVTEEALRQGLQVWLSPELFNRSGPETIRYLIRAATAAEPLRRQWPGRLVFSVGSESTLFMRGILPGTTISKRVTGLFREGGAGEHASALNAFLGQASAAVRKVFGGDISYASLPFESVDWSLLDLVGVDHYREARVKERYAEMLRPLFAHGKPVVVTEFGMRAYRGADSSGALGFGIVDTRSLFLHQLPLLGKIVQPRLKKGDWQRDGTYRPTSSPRPWPYSMPKAPTVPSSANSSPRRQPTAGAHPTTWTCLP